MRVHTHTHVQLETMFSCDSGTALLCSGPGVRHLRVFSWEYGFFPDHDVVASRLHEGASCGILVLLLRNLSRKSLTVTALLILHVHHVHPVQYVHQSSCYMISQVECSSVTNQNGQQTDMCNPTDAIASKKENILAWVTTLVFLAPSGAQGVTMSVPLAQSYLKHCFFIYLSQVYLRSISGLSRVCLRFCLRSLSRSYLLRRTDGALNASSCFLSFMFPLP